MPLDYSKWDNVELSDDSDIEVHPNVDKKSFIRAKQNQIHQKRFERKNKIETYKYERTINEGLLKRINRLLVAFQSHKAEAEKKNPDEIIFQAIIESVEDPTDDTPPPRPASVHTEEKALPSYSKMIAVLVDQVKAKIEKDNSGNRFEAYITEIKAHQTKVEELQQQLEVELATLEKEGSKAITSESYHTGFETSQISKPDPKPAPKKGKVVQSVEVLNPHALSVGDGLKYVESSVADSNLDETMSDSDDIETSEIAKKFAKIKIGDYKEALQFISTNPEILREEQTDGLLVLAFDYCLEEQYDSARQCVHQGLLIQYCRVLGRDGVGVFFKKITTPGHQAKKVFNDDVNTTFEKVKSRAKEVKKNRLEENGEGSVGVETIQLHAVDQGTTLHITIPPTTSEDPAEVEARKIFEAFPPSFQRALETKNLDKVNKILGNMDVAEAEELVGKLGESGMLSLDRQIIDVTTEEGRKALETLDEQERAYQEATVAEDIASGIADDPE